MEDGLALAHRCHDSLPWHIRRYLTQQRGIRDDLVDSHLLGWNGQRITIPVFDRQGDFAFFKLAKDPEDTGHSPKMLASLGAHAELYGWEQVERQPEQIIICEGEFDRLVLESHGFPAVTSTAGARVFRQVWAEALREIPEAFVCFDRDRAGQEGTLGVARLLPEARIIELTREVGEGGDVTDFFVRLGARRSEFLKLMEQARPVPPEALGAAKQSMERPFAGLPRHPDERVAQVKRSVPIAGVISQYVLLTPSGRALMGLCPFHEDHQPSLAVYPETGRFYCFGCQRHGDVIAFLMEKEGLTFLEALDALSLTLPKHGATRP